MNYPDKAMRAYRDACKEYWSLAEEYRKALPHPADFASTESASYDFQQWDVGHKLATAVARAKMQQLEMAYPGIGEEYEERRFLACQAEEDRRFEEHYR